VCNLVVSQHLNVTYIFLYEKHILSRCKVDVLFKDSKVTDLIRKNKTNKFRTESVVKVIEFSVAIKLGHCD